MSEPRPAMGILVGGGPAPGLNGVISAVTLVARSRGLEVFGFLDGFQHLMEGRTDQIIRLDHANVLGLEYQGGSFLRTARANPGKDPALLDKVVESLRSLGVKYLVTTGGDDTATSASKVAARANGAIAVAHVPKTIDNDLPLPDYMPTFGYETARHVGTEIVRALAIDARTAPRWFLVVAMGRKAGHLALGIGRAAGANLTLIAEDFTPGKLTLAHVCDQVEASIVRERAASRNFGVAVMAEGLAEYMSQAELDKSFGGADLPRDEFGHIRLEDVDLGTAVRDELRKRFAARGVKIGLTAKNVGYELRCADPIPFDREYTRNLGFGAVDFLLGGGSNALITFFGGKLEAVPFEKMVDPATGRPPARLVNTQCDGYRAALAFQSRLQADELADPKRLAELAAAAKMDGDAFRARFAAVAR